MPGTTQDRSNDQGRCEVCQKLGKLGLSLPREMCSRCDSVSNPGTQLFDTMFDSICAINRVAVEAVRKRPIAAGTSGREVA